MNESENSDSTESPLLSPMPQSTCQSLQNDSSQSSETEFSTPSTPPPIIRKCFICKKEGAKAFNSKTLAMVTLCLKKREYHNLQNSDVTLPEDENDESLGYCPWPCYKNFTTLNKRYVLPEKEYVSICFNHFHCCIFYLSNSVNLNTEQKYLQSKMMAQNKMIVQIKISRQNGKVNAFFVTKPTKNQN